MPCKQDHRADRVREHHTHRLGTRDERSKTLIHAYDKKQMTEKSRRHRHEEIIHGDHERE